MFCTFPDAVLLCFSSHKKAGSHIRATEGFLVEDFSVEPPSTDERAEANLSQPVSRDLRKQQDRGWEKTGEGE